jgi:hypothetical protein
MEQIGKTSKDHTTIMISRAVASHCLTDDEGSTPAGFPGAALHTGAPRATDLSEMLTTVQRRIS